MSIVRAKKIQKKYGSLVILSDLSFSIERGDKVALVGDNGTGKTTLLKTIAGLEEPDGGALEIVHGVRIGYLPQDTSLSKNETISGYLKYVSGISMLEKKMAELSTQTDDPQAVRHYEEMRKEYEHINGYAFEHRAKIMLAGLGVDDVDLHNKTLNLSSGQKSKVILAGILLKGVDLLLLDEPTNNLDLPALIWLENFIQKTDAACIVVSHDRRFLDRTVGKIFELNRHTRELTINKGTYSDYLEMKKKKISRQKEEYRSQQEEIERLEESARKKKTDATAGSHWKGTDNDRMLKGFKRERAAGSFRTAKTIIKRIEQMNKLEKPINSKPLAIKLKAETNSSTLDVEISDLIAGYQGRFRIGPISLEVRYGSRIGIMGLNGSGKSTILKTLTGQLPPLNGKIKIGSGVRIGNMMQEHETLPRDASPLDILMKSGELSQSNAYSVLAHFGFNEKQAKLAAGTLSPGGRARLLLALFSIQSVNMLVLDEPTNHLDLDALEALEEMIKTYEGTILLVSHDRYFLEKASLDTVYILSNGLLKRIPDYKEYIISAEGKAEKLLKLL
ncbi:MAG: ABC-F family ATP-binding cassette domain-containing protein [Parcubacteria group bacterium]